MAGSRVEPLLRDGLAPVDVVIRIDNAATLTSLARDRAMLHLVRLDLQGP